MPSFIGDIGSLMPINTANDIKTTNKKAGSSDLGMEDFLKLMVAQFQNQDPDNAADTSDMLNQMMQMTVIQAIQNITDATSSMYSASLVGKEVTLGQYNKQGILEEIVGTVTATGMYGGKQVVFVDDKSYYLSDVMAIGKLPEKPNTPATPVTPPATDLPENTNNPNDDEE
jgi:flagellar basal-body rod modification protein FlgD